MNYTASDFLPHHIAWLTLPRFHPKNPGCHEDVRSFRLWWDHWSISTMHSRLQDACPEKLGSALPDSNGFFTRYSIYLAWQVSPGPGEENITHVSEASHNARGGNLVTVHSKQSIQGNHIYIFKMRQHSQCQHCSQDINNVTQDIVQKQQSGLWHFLSSESSFLLPNKF